MGLTFNRDVFCTQTDRALTGIKGVHKLVDDVLVMGATKKELMRWVLMVMEQCHKNGIELSASKAQVGTEVKFAGFIVKKDGTKPDPVKIEAIPNFPVPKDLTNLNSYQRLKTETIIRNGKYGNFR